MIRQVGFEFTKLKTLMVTGGEWIAYHLSKYLGKNIKDFKKWLQDINIWLKENLPRITKMIAEFITRIYGVASVALGIIKGVAKGIGSIIDVLPSAGKAFLALFAVIALGFKLNPVLLMLTSLFLMLEDYWVWAQGKKGGYETDTLFGPLWESLGGIGDKLSGPLKELQKSIKDFFALFNVDLKGMKMFEMVLDSIADKAMKLAGALRGAISVLRYMFETSGKEAKIQDEFNQRKNLIQKRTGIPEDYKKSLLRDLEVERREAISSAREQAWGEFKSGMSEAREMIFQAPPLMKKITEFSLGVAGKITGADKFKKEYEQGSQRGAQAAIPQVYMDQRGNPTFYGETAAANSNLPPFDMTINFYGDVNKDNRDYVTNRLAEEMQKNLTKRRTNDIGH
jgi:hypothetical protein